MGYSGSALQTWTIVIMSYSIIQILTHLTLMILELMEYNCIHILNENDDLHSFYFFNNGCTPNKSTSSGNYTNYESQDYFSQRTEILAIYNIVIDSIWLILTISILVFHCAKKTPRSYFWTIIVWLVLAAIANISDLTSMILYAVDFTNIEAPEFVPFLMMLGAGRFFIFFILNVAAWIYLVVIGKKIDQDTSSRLKQRTVPLKPPKPAIKNSRPTHLQEDNIPRVEDWYKHYENNNRPDEPENVYPRLHNKPYGSSSSDSDPYRPQDYHNNSNNGHPKTVGSPTNVMINGVPSGTLRRQLPWSYVHEPGVYPRRQTRQVGRDAPPVPVPDYTLRLHGNPKFEDSRWAQYPPPPPPPAPKPNWRGLTRY